MGSEMCIRDSSNVVSPGSHAAPAALTGPECRRLTGLTRRQRRVCRRNAENMVGVRHGARLAVDECQWQFRARRWNCSVPPAAATATASVANATTPESTGDDDQRSNAAVTELLAPSITIGDHLSLNTSRRKPAQKWRVSTESRSQYDVWFMRPRNSTFTSNGLYLFCVRIRASTPGTRKDASPNTYTEIIRYFTFVLLY